MDKYEFNIKVEQIKKLVNKKDFATAMKIADTIDWRRVRNANLLSMISQVYEKNREYQEAKEVLLLAFERAPIGKRLLYKLTELALREGSVGEAEDYYREFCDLAPDDTRQHILRYMLLREKKAPVEQLIHALERYTSVELDEKWMYELAVLYAKAGRTGDCVQMCDKMILMFGVGVYVERAMELKQRYAPLTHYQQDLVQNRDKYEEKLRAVEAEYENGMPGMQLYEEQGSSGVGFGAEETGGYEAGSNSYMPANGMSAGIDQGYLYGAGSNMSGSGGYVPSGNVYSQPSGYGMGNEGYIQPGTGYMSGNGNYAGTGSEYVSANRNYSESGPGYAPEGGNYVQPGMGYVSVNGNYAGARTGYISENGNYVEPGSGYAPGVGNYAEPGPGYVPGTENYAEPGPGYASGTGNYVEPGPGYASGTENYVEPGPGYTPGMGNYVEPGSGYVPGTGNYVEPGMRYAPGAGNYVQPENGYASLPEEYDQRPDSYVPGNGSYGQPGQGYMPEGGNYSQLSSSYASEDGSYVQPVGGYVSGADNYSQPVGGYVSGAGNYSQTESGYVPTTGNYAPSVGSYGHSVNSHMSGAGNNVHSASGQYMEENGAYGSAQDGSYADNSHIYPGDKFIDEELVASFHQAAAEKELAAEMSRISTEGYVEQEPQSGRTKVFRQRAANRVAEAAARRAAEKEKESQYHDRVYTPHHLMIESKSPETGFETAVEVLKKIHQKTGVNNQVIKISGSKLSNRGVFNVSDKLAGKDLIIEEAGDLRQEDLEELQMLLERDETGMIVVLIDNPYQMEELHHQNPGFINLFKCINADQEDREEDVMEEETYHQENVMEEFSGESYMVSDDGSSEGGEDEWEDESEQESGVLYREDTDDEVLDGNFASQDRAVYENSVNKDEYMDEYESEAEDSDEREIDSEYEDGYEDEYDGEQEYNDGQESYEDQEYDDSQGYDDDQEYDDSQESYEDQEYNDGQEYDGDQEYDDGQEYDDQQEYDDDREYDEDQEYDDSQEYDDQQGSGYERPVDDEELDLNDFADYAVKYASEIDCSITGKSMLALYERIEIMEEDGIPLTRSNAEDLIEEAADKAEKPSLGGLIKGVFSSKYDKDGLLILKEEHFI